MPHTGPVVYLSYSEEDAPLAARISAGLADRGFLISPTLLRENVRLLVIQASAVGSQPRIENDVGQALLSGIHIYALLGHASPVPPSLRSAIIIRFPGDPDEALSVLARLLGPAGLPASIDSPDRASPPDSCEPGPPPPYPVPTPAPAPFPSGARPAPAPAAPIPPPPSPAPPVSTPDSFPTGAHRVPAPRSERTSSPLSEGLFDGLLSAASRLLARLKPAFPTETAPPAARTDNVRFSVTTHSALQPGKHAELIVWAHLAEHEPLILAKAMAALGIHALHQLLFRSTGPVPLERGIVLDLTLTIDDIPVRNPTRRLTWTGDAGNANFVLFVPPDTPDGPRPASCAIAANGLEIARLDFLVTIGPASETIPARLTPYRRAFASYASEDRDAVLMTIRGMQKIAPALDIFLDVTTLRSNDDWQQKLVEAIARADVFYLFWCSHAARSEWVNKEWQCALQSKGLSFINPVPLQPPDLAPPPAELKAHKHFNDPILAFVKQHTL
ncbi:MAG: toll/interleukin-1 receptor domain-containing protein [Bryobacteraceae bacterium]|nr:toll/interleukin-1 receptor domain-containing protein [Bryobacteraceae bacterium]